MTENLDSQYLSQIMAGLYKGSTLPIAVDVQQQTLEPLQSILTQVGTSGQAVAPHYFKPGRMDTKAAQVFASTSNYTSEQVQQTLDAANAELSNVNLHAAALKYSLFYWAYAYGARIAKSGELPGVSAFDSNRVQAAKWVCDQQLQAQKSYLLLKGDISGIQNFIYYDADKNLEEPGRSKKLSKRLRGRSFYVGLLTDFLAEEVVRRTGLEQANIIYSGGGNFLILLPDLETVKQNLEALEKATNLSLMQQVGRGLGVYLGVAECKEDVLNNFGETVMEVNRVIERKKNRQHKSYLKEVMDLEVTTPRFEPKPAPSTNTFKDDEWLGDKVPYSHFLVELHFKKAIPSNLLDHAAVVKSLQDFNVVYCMVGETRQHQQFDAQAEREKEIGKIKALLERYRDHLTAATIHLLNDTDFLQWSKDLEGFSFPLRYGFKFIGNEAPRYDDAELEGIKFKDQASEDQAGILTFDDLATLQRKVANTKELLGYQQLAVLRLDVDDLGAIFAYGLTNAQHQVTLRQVSSLSREMHLFFSGYFNHLAEEHRLYVTYSGGDDAFVVGSWINVVHFAEALKLAFDRFVCHNSNMHFSAGIYFCNPHFPVAKFANETAELEKRSKKYFKGDKTQTVAQIKQTIPNLNDGTNGDKLADKDAIHVFNKTLSWEKFRTMLDFALDLDQFVMRGSSEKKGNSLSHAVVQRLLAIIKSSRQAVEAKDDMMFYTNIARLHYLLARNNFGDKQLKSEDRTKLQDLIGQLLRDFGTKQTFDEYLIPTQYILYSHRKSKEVG